MNDQVEARRDGAPLPEKTSTPLPLTTCSRLRCEECDVQLPASREVTPVLTAVKAKNAGVWVKNFIIFGDESGYHYFCCADHGKAWREKNIPSANSQAQPPYDFRFLLPAPRLVSVASDALFDFFRVLRAMIESK